MSKKNPELYVLWARTADALKLVAVCDSQWRADQAQWDLHEQYDQFEHGRARTQMFPGSSALGDQVFAVMSACHPTAPQLMLDGVFADENDAHLHAGGVDMPIVTVVAMPLLR